MTMEMVRAATDQRRCALYRHFDENDVLLYVGITESLGDRTNSGHARTSDWVRFAARAEAEWHDSRELASAAEREAVRDEVPIFNRQYAEGNVDLQIMEYLHQRQVDDLRATAEEYEATVRRFLSLAPADDVKRAEAKALRDYRCAGQDLDDRFPASVLRHVANAIEDRANEVQDDAESEAYLAVVEFAAQRLEAIRDRRLSIAKPPF